MRIDLGALLRGGWALWRRDHAILLPLAGMTMFLPPLAARLLLPEPPSSPRGEVTDAIWQSFAQTLAEWVVRYGWWHVAAAMIASFGGLVVYAVYLDRRRPALGEAFGLAALTFPRYVIAYALIFLAAGVGAAPVLGILGLILPPMFSGVLFFAPLFYLSARMLMIGPALIAEPGLGIVGAIGRSWRLTRGNGWSLAWTMATATLTGWLAATLLLMLGDLAGTGNAANPVVAGIVGVLAMGAVSTATLAIALLAVVAYRRLASSGT